MLYEELRVNPVVWDEVRREPSPTGVARTRLAYRNPYEPSGRGPRCAYQNPYEANDRWPDYPYGEPLEGDRDVSEDCR